VTGPFHVRGAYQMPATNARDARFEITAAVLFENSCVVLGLVFSHLSKDRWFCLKEEGSTMFLNFGNCTAKASYSIRLETSDYLRVY